MKTFRYTFPFFLLLSSVAVLSGCSQDELLEETTPIDTSRFITVTVNDNGYKNSNGTSTRTIENGYNTNFTVGDEIGLYAVKEKSLLPEIKNIRLIASDDGKGGITWLDENGQGPLYVYQATYFAYYPYQNLSPEYKPWTYSPDPNIFFDTILQDWELAIDQSNYTDYTHLDLMTAKSSVNPSPDSGRPQLSFSMKHCMALVVIDLPSDATNIKFSGFTPYRMSNGTYRYLMKTPTQFSSSYDKPISKQFIGSYTDNKGSTMEWNFTASGIPANNYQVYTVDGGSSK